MSLATRCTACGTIFRVVQDQLKVSEGWVRCGRCDAVFSAMESLFDLERDAPPEWPAKPPTAPVPEPAFTAPTPAYAGAHSPTYAAAPAPAPAPAPVAVHTAAPALAHATAQFPQQAPSEFTPLAEPPMEPHREVIAVDPVLEVAPGEPALASAGVSDFMASEQTAASPDFVRHADKAQRWKHSGARLALAVTAVLMLALLGAQAAIHFRDFVAARWPQTKPALVSACTWLQCSVGLPRRIEDLAVENTALTHTIPGSDAFKLSVTLRNRGNLTVALPSVDLSLTDASGQLVARRALTPSDFLASAPGLNAGAETTLSLMLNAGEKRVTGYTVEVFYP
jgi:predicted Zn finger-like uncharacterized protein